MKRLFTVILLLTMLTSIVGFSTSVKAVSTETIEPILIIGGKQGSKTSEFDEPDSVFISKIDGKIYAGDTNNLRVQVFDQKGNYLTSFTGFTPLSEAAGNEVQGIGELSDGTIVVIEKAGNLTFFNPENGEIKHITDLSDTVSDSSIDTQGLAVDPRNDNIYITNQPVNMMYVIASNGSLIDSWSIGKFTTPENLVIDAENDRIFVSAEGQNKILVFSSNGTLITDFGSGEASFNFEGLALDPLGNILAMDEGGETAGTQKTSRFIIFDREDFTPLYSVGDTQSGTEPGQFISPDGLAYDFVNNRVFVADQGNFRIQAFDYIDILSKAGIFTDSNAPTVEDADDLRVDAGSSVTVSWDVNENTDFSAKYSITANDEKVASGFFFSNKNVSYTLTVDSDTTLVLTVTDAFGNTANDTVVISLNTSEAKTPLSIVVIPLAFVTIDLIRRRFRKS